MTTPESQRTIDAGVRPGEVLLGKYRVERIIGLGGMGCVVEAWHEMFEERVAIKLLLASLLDNEEAMARFEREARVLFKLKSENVCRVIDYGQLENGVPFMVMEHLDGQDLASMLEKREPMPFEQSVDYALQLCNALAHAHVRGIVHRDLKPENVFIVDPDGERNLKLLDFGLSKIRGTTEPTTRQRKLTSKEQVMGTPQYMSPEQWLASKDVGAATDQWAVGVILYEMLTGHLPFEGEHIANMCTAILNSPAPSLAVRRPDVPASFDLLLRKALEKNPRDRYENVGALAMALAAHMPSASHAAKAERVQKMLEDARVREDSGEWSVIKPPKMPSDMSVTLKRPPRFDALVGQLRSITSTSWQRMLRREGNSRAAMWLAGFTIVALAAVAIWALSYEPEPPAPALAAPAEPATVEAPSAEDAPSPSTTVRTEFWGDEESRRAIGLEQALEPRPFAERSAALYDEVGGAQATRVRGHLRREVLNMRPWIPCAALLMLVPGLTWAQDRPEGDGTEPPPDGSSPEPQGQGGEQGGEGGQGGDGQGGDDIDQDPTDEADRAAAESLLRTGRDLMDLGQYDEAAAKLLESLRARPSADAAYLLGEAQDRRGLVASAWAAYRQAASMLRHAHDPREADAEEHARALQAKVPRITIQAASSVPGLEIRHGETRFDDGVLGVALAVDPGEHRIEARAPGYKAWSTTVRMRASERRTVTIPALAKLAEPAAAVPAEEFVHGAWWTAGLVTGAIGIASLGTGALLGAIAAAHVHDAEDDPSLCGSDRTCTPAGWEKVDQADAEATASTVLISVGGIAVVAGFVMVLFDEPRREVTATKRKPAEARAFRAWPWAGPGGGGVAVGGSF